MASFVIWISSSAFCVCLIQFISAYVNVNLHRRGLRYVPQDITSDVTHLSLTDNIIQVLYSTSFSRYENLTEINLSENPIWKINNGVFDSNPLLKRFNCRFCDIEVLPASFGPSTSKIYGMGFGNGLSEWGIFTNFLTDFISLEILELSESRYINIDDINVSPSIKLLGLRQCSLSHFPNISSAKFPALSYLTLESNEITNISDSGLASMPKNLTALDLSYNYLKEIGDMTVLTNLDFLTLRGNGLETIPDMLDGLPKLQSLQIALQGRMSCDQRMCWRRLWNRVRAPLVHEDDVMCKGPPEIIFEIFRRYPDIGLLSLMDPGFMQCNQGEDWC